MGREDKAKVQVESKHSVVHPISSQATKPSRGEMVNIKDIEEGGGCVNTQTGSVGVAASQSNIVIVETEDSLAKRGRAVPQSSLNDESMKNVKGESMNVKNVNSMYAKEYEKSSMKSMSGVQPEGRNKKVNTSSKSPSLRSKENSKPNLKHASFSSTYSTQRLREYFTALSSSGGNVGRGENTNITPIKRKLLIEKQVPNLVETFSIRVQEIASSESKQMGSPAKRQKVDFRGQTPLQQTDNNQ